jgi:hypothetical protein
LDAFGGYGDSVVGKLVWGRVSGGGWGWGTRIAPGEFCVS